MTTARLITQVEIKAVDASQRLITGYAGALGNKDRVGDVIDAGAFDRTLKENPDVLVFVGHDASRMPVGEPTSMVTDVKGLLTTTRVYKTHAGDELLEVAAQRMATGRTLGMSIGYRAVKSGYVGATRHLKDVDLIEYSFLASPILAANPEATVVGIKARKEFGGTSTLETSYEDLQSDLRDACAAALKVGWVDIAATYSDHVVVRTSKYNDSPESSESAYWDFPYTLGDDGEPTVGEPKAVQPAFVAGAAKEWVDLEVKHEAPPRSVDIVDLNKLPDGSFAYIAPGGMLDEEKMTVPRASRHYAHHDAEGKLDQGLLDSAIAEAEHDGANVQVVAHLRRHAFKSGTTFWDSDGVDDAHSAEFASGATPALFVLLGKMAQLVDSITAEHLSMKHLGIDTKGGAKLQSETRQALRELLGDFSYVLDQADLVERGADGTARVDVLSRRLELLEV